MNYCCFNILKPKQFLWSSCDCSPVTWGHLHTFSQAVYGLEQQTLKKKKIQSNKKRHFTGKVFASWKKIVRNLSGCFSALFKGTRKFRYVSPRNEHPQHIYLHTSQDIFVMHVTKEKKLQPFLHLKSIDYSTLFTATDSNASYFKAQPFCALYLNHLWHMDK